MPHQTAISTRLHAVEEDVRELKRMFETGFATIHAKLDERSRIPWPAWSLLFAGLLAVGAFAYWPIREQIIELRAESKERAQEVRTDNLERYKDLLERDRRIWVEVMAVKTKIERLEAVYSHERNRNQ